MLVTRCEEFEMAHVLNGYDGGCGNLHGHSYKIEVTLTGRITGNFGMILDFKILKEVIKSVIPDHKFAVNKFCPVNSYEWDLWQVNKKFEKATIEFPFCPTAENMVIWFACEINKQLKAKIDSPDPPEVVKVVLWETSNSCAVWEKRES